jgi:hypothetical protein
MMMWRCVSVLVFLNQWMLSNPFDLQMQTLWPQPKGQD